MRTPLIEKLFGRSGPVQPEFRAWVKACESNDHTSILSASINLSLTKTKAKDNRNREVNRWCSVAVRGYRIIMTVVKGSRVESEPLFVYSPLLKRCVGRGFTVMVEGKGGEVDWGLNLDPPLLMKWRERVEFLKCGPEPLGDEDSRKTLFALHLSTIDDKLVRIALGFRVNSRETPTFIAQRRFDRNFADEKMALVCLINSMSSGDKAKLLADYDTYGPPEGVVGDALKHIDNFRSDG